MAGVFCGCGGGLHGNTGIAPNAFTFKNIKGILLVPLVALDGTKNVIEESDFVDGKLPQSFINEKLAHADYSKRWYLIKDFESTPTNERADPITEQVGNGNNRITDLGIRSLVATKQKENESEQRNYERLACLSLGVYQIDRCGTLQGYAKSGATQFKPLPLGQFYTKPLPATESTTAQIQIQYEIKQTVADGDFDIIPSEFVTDTDGYLLDEAESLQNMLVEITSPTTTGFTAKLSVEAGNYVKRLNGTGWATSDFALQNKTTGSPIVITSATETVAGSGEYAFVIPAQTSSDVVVLSGAVSGNVYVKTPYELQETEFTLA